MGPIARPIATGGSTSLGLPSSIAAQGQSEQLHLHLQIPPIGSIRLTIPANPPKVISPIPGPQAKS